MSIESKEILRLLSMNICDKIVDLINLLFKVYLKFVLTI